MWLVFHAHTERYDIIMIMVCLHINTYFSLHFNTDALIFFLIALFVALLHFYGKSCHRDGCLKRNTPERRKLEKRKSFFLLLMESV
jgi:hypothetical protein